LPDILLRLTDELAFGIFHLKGLALQNWQYLFIIEGSLTVLLAIVAWVWLPDGPGSAWFLDHYEREFAANQINNDTVSFRSESDEVKARGLTKRDFIEAGKDWKTWYVLLFNICASVPSQAFSVFLPLVVVHGLGFSSIEANLVSVPPFICGAVGLYLVAFSSDRHQERGYHIIFGISITLVGLIIVVTAERNAGKYVGLCVLLTGSYISPPLTMVCSRAIYRAKLTLT
jgi:sugar phosphate permease